VTPRPSLGFTRFGRPRDAAPLVVALGDREHTLDAWLQPLRGDFSLVSLDAPRAADPRRFGVPTRSGDWYLAYERGAEPNSFGLSLIALEGFVLHERRSIPQPPILFGVGQGATLCLTLARCWAEALAGVVAIDGRVAELPTAAIEEAPLSGLPILIVEQAEHGHEGPDTSEPVATHLVERGGRVTLARDADARQTAQQLVSWLADVVGGPSEGPRRPSRIHMSC
jgi:predicted esterase